MRHLLLIVSLVLISSASFASPKSSYFYSGDGRIDLHSNLNGLNFNGTYRNPDGTYNAAALRTINKAFAAKLGNPATEISPRFIEFLDYVGDHFKPNAKITITSGYRSPSHNMGLRKNGRLAAKASLHQYGMAADVKFAGVSSQDVWNFVKDLGFGGVGFYHGANVHVDTGPARFWDETSSKVDTDISDNNKLIGLVTDKDVYLGGENVNLRFIRMTSFPVDVSQTFQLEEKGKGDKWNVITKANVIQNKNDQGCAQFNDIVSMAGFGFALPEDTKPGRYHIVASFCGELPEGMPPTVATPEFEVQP